MFRLFLDLVFRKRHIIADIWLCFRACNSRIVTYDQEFCLVVWLMCFNHYYGIFRKVSLKKSWCCRKHVFVFEIVSLKVWTSFLIKLSFSLWLLGKRFHSPLWKKFENFSTLGVDFFLKKKKVKLLNLGGWLFASNLSKGLNVLAIFRSVVKIEVFSEGKARRKFFASGFAFERLTFLSKVKKNRLKRGNMLWENFTRKDILNFKKCLDNGNLWFLPFSFQWLHGHTFWTENQISIWSYSKRFWSVLARFFKKHKPM
jgi:hypothetical protein